MFHKNFHAIGCIFFITQKMNLESPLLIVVGRYLIYKIMQGLPANETTQKKYKKSIM